MISQWKIFNCPCIIVDTSISGLSITTSTRFVNLRWQPLMAVTNVIYTYEVAYISRPDNTECSGDLTTLPDGYTVYPVNISSNNIEVFDLIPDTCYIFGVRVHVSIANTIGEFSLIWKATISEGKYFMFYRVASMERVLNYIY